MLTHSFKNSRIQTIKYGSILLLTTSLISISLLQKSVNNGGTFFPASLKDSTVTKSWNEPADITYLKSFLKSPANLEQKVGESFYASLNYLRGIKNADVDWTSALPILPPSYSIRKAGANSFLFDDLHHYSPYNGHPALRKAIQDRLQRDGIKAEEENIIVHTSVFEIVEGIYSSLDLTADDSILIATPTFGYYASQASKCPAKIHFIKASKKSAWKICPKELDMMLTQTKAKIFLFANPVNPTGVVYTKQEIAELAAVLKKHRTLVISDEIFKDVVLNDTQPPFSIGAVEGMENFTITLNGVGKSMGLAGLRISYGHVPSWLMERLPKPLCGLSISAEKAAVQALKNTEENHQYLEKTTALYKKKIESIKNLVSQTNQELHEKFKMSLHHLGHSKDFVKVYIEPKATNVVLLSFSGLQGKSFENEHIQTSLQLAKYLYKKAGVAMVPGEASFIEGKEMVLRIPLAAKNLNEGFMKIKNALLQLTN